MKLPIILLLTAITVAAQTQPHPIATDPGGANLPAQKIGPNDLLNISVYDAPELTRTVRVGADGLIRLPMLKRQIKADGLMPAQLEAAIADAVTAEQLIVDPFVTVTVAEYISYPISVAGAVKQPTTFQANGPVTLLEAITRAGGLSPEAGSEILISRPKTASGSAGDSLVQRIPVRGLIDAADPALNILLKGGEEVRVPDVGKIYVIGNVHHPGVFPMQGNSDATVLKVLASAEGLMPFANNDAYIYRREGSSGSKNEISIPLRKIMQRKAPDVALMADDILYVPDATGRRATWATLEKILLFGTGASTALIYSVTR